LQALVRVGLGLLLTLAPALCCCQARWLFASAAAPSGASAEPAPRSAPSCPHCCQAETPAAPTPEAPAPKPLPTHPHCIFCDGQAVAITADPGLQLQPPVFTGELLPAFMATVAHVHPASAAGLSPSERTGVDARSAALFDRHVMRC
jgi:hypothetical protein